MEVRNTEIRKGYQHLVSEIKQAVQNSHQHQQEKDKKIILQEFSENFSKLLGKKTETKGKLLVEPNIKELLFVNEKHKAIILLMLTCST